MYYMVDYGDLLDVFGSDSKYIYWNADVKKALGLDKSAGGFPPQLSPGGEKLLFQRWFSRSRTEFEKNIQQPPENLRPTRPVFHRKGQRVLSKSQTETQYRERVQNMASRQTGSVDTEQKA